MVAINGIMHFMDCVKSFTPTKVDAPDQTPHFFFSKSSRVVVERAKGE